MAVPSCPLRQFFVSFVELLEGPNGRSKADNQVLIFIKSTKITTKTPRREELQS